MKKEKVYKVKMHIEIPERYHDLLLEIKDNTGISFNNLISRAIRNFLKAKLYIVD